MTPTIDLAPFKVPAAFRWLTATGSHRDVLEVLAGTLGPMWSVHRETDYEGEVSIFVLPDGDGVGPAFVLYEKAGLARVGTVCGDTWMGDEVFSGIDAAMTAIIAKIVSAAARPTGEMATLASPTPDGGL